MNLNDWSCSFQAHKILHKLFFLCCLIPSDSYHFSLGLLMALQKIYIFLFSKLTQTTSKYLFACQFVPSTLIANSRLSLSIFSTIYLPLLFQITSRCSYQPSPLTLSLSPPPAGLQRIHSFPRPSSPESFSLPLSLGFVQTILMDVASRHLRLCSPLCVFLFSLQIFNLLNTLLTLCRTLKHFLLLTFCSLIH